VVALGDVHELEVHRERAHYPPELPDAHGVYPPPEPFVELRGVVEAQPLAQEPDLLLGLEEVLTLLLDEDATERPPEEVDVPAQRLVFRLALGTVVDLSWMSTPGRVTLPLLHTTTERKYSYIGTTGDRTCGSHSAA
jgi:hypothetical protein